MNVKNMYDNQFTPEFNAYLHARYSGNMEVIPATLYDTMTLLSGVTKQLVFFNDVNNKTRAETNMYLPGYLPDPQAFLIHNIAICGITSATNKAAATLHIMNKHYGSNPVLCHALKSKGMSLHPRLMLPPLAFFSFVIDWEEPPVCGADFNGNDIQEQRVQVILTGVLARAVC